MLSGKTKAYSCSYPVLPRISPFYLLTAKKFYTDKHMTIPSFSNVQNVVIDKDSAPWIFRIGKEKLECKNQRSPWDTSDCRFSPKSL